MKYYPITSYKGYGSHICSSIGTNVALLREYKKKNTCVRNILFFSFLGCYHWYRWWRWQYLYSICWSKDIPLPRLLLGFLIFLVTFSNFLLYCDQTIFEMFPLQSINIDLLYYCVKQTSNGQQQTMIYNIMWPQIVVVK
jgi:hypothetical protein